MLFPIRGRQALALTALLLAGAAHAGAQTTAPAQGSGAPTGKVRVAGGEVRGFVASSGVRTFRGIPFAAPPVGELRWQPPQPVVAWKGVRDATRFGPRCMQAPIFSDMVFRSNGVGEDCLYLNVWTPADKTAARLPVLVYFYGGGFIAGDGSEFRYDGESLARRGLVTVTVNYRLGVFGFLAHPELTRESPHHASGNYGLLDQAAALRWVHDNIGAFGGDPAHVTIAGESAGSISVSVLMASPLSRELIAGAIGESGALIGPTLPAAPLAQGEAAGVSFARTVGATSLAELRRLPADTLLRATATPDVGRFAVVLDGWLLPATPTEIFTAGQQAHVPLLAGWNSEEANGGWLLGSSEPTPANWAAALRKLYGERADEALRFFPGGNEQEVRASATLLAGANFIAYGTWKWQELHARTSGRPVYRYLYARPRPELASESALASKAAPAPAGASATKAAPPRSGAVHSAEIEYALGNLATNPVYAWTPDDQRVSDTMQGYFANFVKSGDPNGPGLPQWPVAAPTGPIMVLDVRTRAEPEAQRAAFEFLDRVYTAKPDADR